LVDAAVVDFGGTEDFWDAAKLARDYPSTPFFGVFAMRTTDGPAIARAITCEFVDVLADGVDDAVVRDLITPHTFSLRFAAALHDPPAGLSLKTPMQLATWRAILPYAGRPIRTSTLAAEVGVTREHLSRHFAQGGAPNLKRVIDLVRLIGAAELSKNPGHDIQDVATVLGFASSSHLAVTASRVLGTRPASLARLRTIDLLERFLQGRTRSRA
jgi:AraC-like DNA-binding protein